MDMWPSCRYHRTKGSQLFQNQAEVDAAGEGWVDTPAKFKEPEGPDAAPPAVTTEQALGKPDPPDTKHPFTPKEVKKMLKRPMYDLLQNVFKLKLGEYDDCRVTELREMLLEKMGARVN